MIEKSMNETLKEDKILKNQDLVKLKHQNRSLLMNTWLRNMSKCESIVTNIRGSAKPEIDTLKVRQRRNNSKYQKVVWKN